MILKLFCELVCNDRAGTQAQRGIIVDNGNGERGSGLEVNPKDISSKSGQ